MGHLITISQALIQTASADPIVDKILSEDNEWFEYVKGPYTRFQEDLNRRADLGGSGISLKFP